METFQNSLELYKALRSCTDPDISKVINESLDILESSIRLYGHSNIFASYNGGKDADVVLHLLRAAWANSFRASQICPNCIIDSESFSIEDVEKIHDSIEHMELIYFQSEGEFEDVINHIEINEKKYHLNIKKYNCSIYEGLKHHLENRPKGQGHAAFILGTRLGDPNSKNQGFFAPSTSSWMPIPFMRVNPIINWNYGQVWKFLHNYSLPYCHLYDIGYTSIGTSSNTLPNPLLKVEHGYLPACNLENWEEERAGRLKVSTSSSSSTNVSSSSSLSPSSSSLSTPCLSQESISSKNLNSNDC